MQVIPDRVSDFPFMQELLQPDAEAMVFGAARTTYAQMCRQIDALARALLAAGIKKGDRVATLQTSRPEFAVAYLAAISIGAIWVGLNPRYRAAELLYVMQDAEPSVLLTRTMIDGRDYTAEIDVMCASVSSLKHVVRFAGDPPTVNSASMASFLARGESISDAFLETARASCGGRDPCLIVYTSGSTGKPKGALLHHEGIATFCAAQNALWPVSPWRAVNYFPINHVGCVVDLTMPVIAAGGTIVFLEQFDPLECLALMEAEGVTFWGSVPSVFQLQLEALELRQFNLSAVKLIVWEGAAMPKASISKLSAYCSRMATNYGMTETTSAITILEPTSDRDVLANSVGRAAPGVEIRLVDSEGKDVPDGTPGEIWARSKMNLLGYWRQPEATREVLLADGFFRTGDLGVRRPDGLYRIAGRLKEMFKSGGHNVYPREIEMVLENHPLVAEVAVVSRPDPVWQEVGVAYVVGRGSLTSGDLDAWCRERLANYKIPKQFEIETALPLLPIGKIDKAALKKRAAVIAEAFNAGSKSGNLVEPR